MSEVVGAGNLRVVSNGSLRRYNHQVSEEEVAEVLESPGEDRPGKEGSRVALGQTSAGDIFGSSISRAVWTMFVITAYELTGKPLVAYRRRRRKKQQ